MYYISMIYDIKREKLVQQQFEMRTLMIKHGCFTWAKRTSSFGRGVCVWGGGGGCEGGFIIGGCGFNCEILRYNVRFRITVLILSY